jgi:phenylpropionate dioxygenase-like ring-hydroxylating dioxygenase large terminal subunit
MNDAAIHELIRRALKLLAEHTTDMALVEHREPARNYCDPQRFAAEKDLVRRSPQLVGYASELPQPGSFATKDVMGTPVLLTRAKDGAVRAFLNICQHRQAPIADGCGIASRLSCPYHAWTYNLDGTIAGIPGQDGFAETREQGIKLAELPAQEYAGFLWVGLDREATLDVEAHLGELGPELTSWNVGSWAPVGEKTLDTPIDWKLALDTFAENYHFASVHTTTFATVAHSNCTVFDSFGPHHRLVFPLRGLEDWAESKTRADRPETEWTLLDQCVVIYAIFPNIVLSVTAANGEIFRVYPGDRPGHSITRHQNAWALPMHTDADREAAEAVFDYAHHTVRDEDYVLAAKIQANLETGLQPDILFGRNEPGNQHRALALRAALEGIS